MVIGGQWPKEPSAKTAPNPSFYAARHYYDGGGYYQNVAFPDGSSYEGDFNADSKFHGRGMFVWKNGDRCWTVRPRPATTLLRPMGVASEACQGKKRGQGQSGPTECCWGELIHPASPDMA